MKKSLKTKLFLKCPLIYRDRDALINVDDGWFDILLDMSIKVERIAQRYKVEGWSQAELPKVNHIESGRGGLSVYFYNLTREIDTIIDETEDLAESICESCGAPGRIRNRGWIAYLCDKCAQEQGKT